MKKIEILCVGKIKEKYFTESIAEYQKRLTRFCDFTIIELADMGDNTNAIVKESDSILAKLNGYTILLDLSGELITSEHLAQTLDTAFVRGNAKVQFIIGGSHGVDARVKAAVDKRIAFGRITYPHQLMRVCLTEQVYRALTISAGTPYHK